MTKLSRRCINQDHEALGTHEIDGAPLNEGCHYPTDYVWAKATGRNVRDYPLPEEER